MDSSDVLNTTSAYARLRDDILKGRRPGGDRLVTQQIADELGVSRTPVKEALAKLESEGLVVRGGNWGYSVRTITFRDAEELFEARLVIEVASARMAADRASEQEMESMQKMLAAAQRHLKAKALPEFQNASRGVHELIAQATGNSQVIRMFRQVNDLVVLFGISLLRLNPERATDILQENWQIVSAIQERRADDAAKSMHQHIVEGHASFRRMVITERPNMRLA
jgi:GntR family transcriptional regulator of vanillate catabolism